jgi:hypothetical protein
MFLKKTLAAAILSVGAISSANANQFEFSYIWGVYGLVTGSFFGTQNGNLVTNLSDISVNFTDNMAGVAGTPYDGSYSGTSFFSRGIRRGTEAILSFDGTNQNFVFSNYDTANIVNTIPSGYQSFSMDFSPYIGAGTYGKSNVGQYFIPSNWHLAEVIQSTTPVLVPEPESLAMMLLGLPMMAWAVRRRKSVFTA